MPEKRWKGASFVLGLIVAVALGSGVAEAVQLPDGRAYELVSPPAKKGGEILANAARTRAAADGNAVTFASPSGFGDVVGMGVATEYVGQRGDSDNPEANGWSTHGITPPQQSMVPLANAFASEPFWQGAFARDLSAGVFRAWSPLTSDPNVAAVQNLYVRRDIRVAGRGVYELITACPICGGTPIPGIFKLNALSQGLRPALAGSSEDLEHVVFESAVNLTSGAPAQSPLCMATGSGCNTRVYEWDHGTVRLASVLPNGDGAERAIAGRGVTGLGPRVTSGAISADGARINFTSNTSGVNGALYQRVNGRTTVQVNASERSTTDRPQVATYWDASLDGNTVFFTSTEALTDDAPVSRDAKLYQWQRQTANESQAVTISATDGTFTLALSGETTAAIAFDAAASVVQSALEALPPIGAGNVSVSGGPGGSGSEPYLVTFTGDLAGVNAAPLTVDGSSLTGGTGASVMTPRPVRNLSFLSSDRERGDRDGVSVQGVIGTSDDGRYVYFVAAGQMVARRPALGSQVGIYAWHEGSVAFVGTSTRFNVDRNEMLDGAPLNSSSRQSRVTPDGRHMLFPASSGEGLLSVRGDLDYEHGVCPVGGEGISGLCRQLYVYSADTDELRCASCKPRAAGGTVGSNARILAETGGAQAGTHLGRPLSDDGRFVFFSTAEALVPEDVNGRFDAYEFDVATGRPRLLSTGTHTSDSYFLDASASGDDVFLVTREQLVGWDVDQAYDLYDARVGGGFPEPVATAAPCAGDGCRGAQTRPPVVGDTGGSEMLRGPGNVRARGGPKPKQCRRGKVRKRVRGKARCVRRHRRSRTERLAGPTVNARRAR